MELDEVCKEYIEDARLYHQDPYIAHKEKKKSFRPRRLTPCVVAAGGFTGKEHSTNRSVTVLFTHIYHHRKGTFESF